MEISLKGRSALITGGSTGLGLAMAKRLSASGADVAILARRPEVIAAAVADIEKTAKGKVAGFPCDVAKAEPLQNAFGGEPDSVVPPARVTYNAHGYGTRTGQGFESVQRRLDIIFCGGVMRSRPALDKAPALPIRCQHQEALPGECRDMALVHLVIAALGMDV